MSTSSNSPGLIEPYGRDCDHLPETDFGTTSSPHVANFVPIELGLVLKILSRRLL